MDKEQNRIKLKVPGLLLFTIFFLVSAPVQSLEQSAIAQDPTPSEEAEFVYSNPCAAQTLSSDAPATDNVDPDIAHQKIAFGELSEGILEDLRGSNAAETNIWDRIRQGFSLPQLRDEHVDHYEQWYSQRPDYMRRLVERARLHLPFIVQQVLQRGYPMEIALLPAIESAFKSNAYSKSHASGLWQFIPATGRRFGLKQNWWYDGRRDVIEATRAALDYLGELNRQFAGDWLLTLAAYNGGEQRVHRAIQYNLKTQQGIKFTDLELKSESRRYVPKLIAFRNIVNNPRKFGIKLSPVSTDSNLVVVNTQGQIDLGAVAKLTDLSPQDLFLLNPAHRRWATSPDGPHRIFVPRGTERNLEINLAKLITPERARWRRYRVESGDTLSSISYRHGVDVYAIKSINRLKSNLIRINQELLIPIYDGLQPLPKSKRISVIAPYANKGHEIYHVRAGDTLWRIAQHYEVYVSQLLDWNTLAADQILELGQKIIVYKDLVSGATGLRSE